VQVLATIVNTIIGMHVFYS